MQTAGKNLTYCEDYAILVRGAELVSDDVFHCEDCGRFNPSTPPTDKDACTYARVCIDCGKRYGIRAWSKKARREMRDQDMRRAIASFQATQHA